MSHTIMKSIVIAKEFTEYSSTKHGSILFIKTDDPLNVKECTADILDIFIEKDLATDEIMEMLKSIALGPHDKVTVI